MYQLLLIFGELILLFFLSRHLLTVMFTLFIKILRIRPLAITLVTILYFPGTVIHELAHWIVAEILRVRTGEISLVPVIEKSEHGVDHVKLGHVQVAQTDPIRKYIIGFAPVFVGMFFLALIIWIVTYFWPQITDSRVQAGIVALAGYLLFTISNNMFSSQKDLEGFIFFTPILILLGLIIYFSGIRIELTGHSLVVWQNVTTGLVKALGIVIGVNIVILLVNGVLLRGLMKTQKIITG